MANNDRNKRTNNGEVAHITREYLTLFGRFFLDLGKLTMRTGWRIFRTLRASQKEEQRTEHQQQSTTPAQADPIEPQLHVNAAESAPSRGRAMRFVDDSAVSDPEAAALLEELLQHTATQMSTEPPADPLTSPTPEAEAKSSYSPSAAEVVDDLIGDVVEPDILVEPEPTPDSEPQAEIQPTDQPITYNTEDEQARIQAQLAQRETMLKQEEETREAVADDEEARQAALREAMRADLARIRAEKAERENRFKEAEEQRKQREAERKNAMRAAARLRDIEPPAKSSTTTDENAADQSET